MKYFLEYVAEDLLQKYGSNMAKIKVIFPNKRAALFLNDYLVQKAGKPIWSPQYTTISELFKQNSTLIIADEISLVCELYKVYCEVTGTDETLDHFFSWGQLMISDFDDIDKHLVDADDLFKNISNIHELDDISYLTDEQRKMLSQFFNSFDNNKNSDLKKHFLNLWSKLSIIYHKYNELLFQKGFAYEGSLYRRVINENNFYFDSDLYIFIGFNMLNRVEEKLFEKLAKKGIAKFYWDFDKYYMDNSYNEASYFIRPYLSAFPNELPIRNTDIYDNFGKTNKQIDLISASTETIQARYTSQWLKSNNQYIVSGRKTAIILCNENLLQPVLHSIPQQVEKLNITMGFPLSLTQISSFISNLISLHTLGKTKDKKKYRISQVRDVLRHPYTLILSNNSTELLKTLEEKHIFFPTPSQLFEDDNLTLIFSDLDADTDSVSTYNKKLINYVIDILTLIGAASKNSNDPLLIESTFRMYTLFIQFEKLINEGGLNIDTTTLQRLINQLIKQGSVPFHGEPAEGLQIMGLLETRNLDFDNILLLSCNDGNIPKNGNDSSFIPYALRKAYGLTIIDHKNSIYSYYFHRLLQRAKNITILYNSSTGISNVREMSRFLLQLRVESKHDINLYTIKAGQTTKALQYHDIEKSDKVMQHLNQLTSISPSALGIYLRNPIDFFYKYVLSLKEKEEDEDGEIDGRIFGNIFHNAVEILYKELQDKEGYLHAETVKLYLRKENMRLAQIVDEAFKQEIYKTNNVTSQIEYNGLELINRNVIIDYLHSCLYLDLKTLEEQPICILGLEVEVYDTIEFGVNNETKQIKISGKIDRIDKVGNKIRVIDYKTGGAKTTRIGESVNEIFIPENVIKNHSDYHLQALLYSYIIRNSNTYNKGNLKVSPSLIFIQRASNKDYKGTLTIGPSKKDIPIDDINDISDDFISNLKLILSEIFDKNTPFIFQPKGFEYSPYNKIYGN